MSHWTEEEVEFLRNNYVEEIPLEAIANDMNRTLKSVKRKAQNNLLGFIGMLRPRQGTEIIFEALKSSKGLVAGRWWATFWRLLAPAFVFTVLLFVVQWVVGLPFETTLGQQIDQTSFASMGTALVYAVVMSIVNLLFTPLTTIATAILYIELKRTPR